MDDYSDLSDGEIILRIVQRGYDRDYAMDLCVKRDDPAVQMKINQLLSR